MPVLSRVILGGLILLYILAQVGDRVFGIRSNRFYAYFHFLGGGLVYLFWQSLISHWLLCLVLTGLVGGVWEIYEFVDWKFFRKRRIYKPGKRDTGNDLVMDLLGGVVALVLTLLLNYVTVSSN